MFSFFNKVDAKYEKLFFQLNIKNINGEDLDLNQFKQINDTLGHSQGDEVLRQAAQRFRGAIRESDTIARLSGDEFAFALPDLPKVNGAVKVAETLINELKTSFQVMGQNFTLGASIGIAIYPDDGISGETRLAS